MYLVSTLSDTVYQLKSEQLQVGHLGVSNNACASTPYVTDGSSDKSLGALPLRADLFQSHFQDYPVSGFARFKARQRLIYILEFEFLRHGQNFMARTKLHHLPG